MVKKHLFKKNKRIAAVILAATLAISTLAGCSKQERNNSGANPSVETTTDSTDATTGSSNEKYTPGTYSAVVTGMHEMTVTITVSEKEIIDIQVDHNETPGIGEPAVASIPAEILELQGLGVDAMSGATLTSNALIEGVIDGLKQAGLTDTDIEELKSITKVVEQEADEQFTADVVVIGAGGAGMAAAVTAHQAGNCTYN